MTGRTQIGGRQILDGSVKTDDLENGAVTDEKMSATGAAAGTFTKVTITDKGRVVAAENPTSLAGYGILDAAPSAPSYVTVNSEVALPNERRLTGVSTEIAIVDNGSNSTLDVGFADNPVFPGSAGVVIPSGTTAERSDPARPAEIRFNETLGHAEGYFDGEWVEIIDQNSPYIAFTQVVRVQKFPPPGIPGTIYDALASITDASATKPYTINVLPGVYVEQQLVMKPYVSIFGSGQPSTIIESADPNEDLIVACPNSIITDVTLTGATGVNSALISLDIADIQQSFFISNSILGSAYQLVKVLRGSIQVSNVAFGGVNAFVRGFLSQNTTTGSRLVLRNVFSTRLEQPYPEYLVKVDGPNAFAVLTSIFNRARGAGVLDTVPAGTGIWVRDGGQIRGQAISILGYDKAVWLENAGTLPTVYLIATTLSSNVQDLVIDHPDAEGAFIGIAESAKSSSASSHFAIQTLDPDTHGTNIVGSLFIGNSLETVTDVTDLIQTTTSTGIIIGADITQGPGALELTISGGYGYASDPVTMRSKKIAWETATITIPDNQFSFISVSSNSTLVVTPVPADPLTSVTVGAVFARAGAIVRVIDVAYDATHQASRLDEYIRNVIGAIVTAGLITTEGSTPRSLSVTGGTVRYSSLTFNLTDSVDITFESNYHVGGSWVFSGGQTTVSNTQYDNGTALTALTAGYFTKHALYAATNLAGESKFYLVYGQEQYATLVEAEAAALPIAPPYFTDCISLAALVVGEGLADIQTLIDLRPRIGATPQTALSASSHGSLSGLSEDDHPQYLLANGSRILTGNLDLNTFNILNVGTIDGLDIETHGTRHNPNGVDPISTAAAVGLTTTSTNTAGSANALARSDHTHQITGFQPLDADLTAIAALATSGFSARTAANTWAIRSLTAPAAGITITNPAGTAGNPTFALANDLAALEGLTTAGIAVKTGVDAWATRSITSTSLDIVNPTGAAGDIAINIGTVGTPGTYRSVTTDSFGRVIAGTAPTTLSGYGITDAQPLDTTLTALSIYNSNGLIAQTSADNFTGRSIAAGSAKITVANGSGIAGNPTVDVSEANLTLNNIGGTLGIAKGGTNLTALGAANTVLGVNAGGTALEYKPFTLAALADTAITAPAAGNVLAYSGTQWINSPIAASSATGLLSAWTLVSGTLYRSDFAHNLGTNNIVITLYDTATNTVVTADEITLISTNTVRVQVAGNTRTIRIVVVANGNTVNTAPQSSGTITTAKDSVNVSTAASRLNFTGQAVTVVDSGAGTTTVSFGSRFTFFAAAFDTPVNADWAVNALAPTVTDPTFGSLSVRQFSNTAEQGVGFLLSVPTSATTVTFRFRGRAQAAPGAVSNVQPRLYVRAIPNNGAVGAWSGALNLTSIAIPTNTFFQYSNQTLALSSLGMTAGVTYQVELTRHIGVASNLAANFLLAELTVEVS